jgi:hypothetical protein
LFEKINGKPSRDVNQAVCTVYSGPCGDHDPNNHSKWNSGQCTLFLYLILTLIIEIHPYKAAPPLFVKKSLQQFVKETKDQTLTQAVHQI